jgi:signal peptidase I
LLVNLLLPGAGFIFSTFVYSSNQTENCSAEKKLKLSKPLLLTCSYILLLLSLLILVSWSGLIFSESGFYYLLLAYVIPSLLSSFHLGYKLYQYKSFSNQCTVTNNVTPESLHGRIKASIVTKIVQVSLPLFYLTLVLLLLTNKQTLLGWQVYQIPSASMYPTLHIGDIVLADTRPATLTNITNQNIVIFKRPSAFRQAKQASNVNNSFYIKRIIASGGDNVAIKNHQLLVNNQPIKSNLTELNLTKRVIDEHALFVLGDNTHNSSDSRTWGQLPSANVVGKFIRIIYRQ